MRLRTLWLLSAVFSLCVVGLLKLQMARASPYTNINVATAYNLIASGSYPDLLVLDVRTQSEYDGGHIYGAVWIPVSELEARIGELVGHENHEIIVYCLSGGRSATASGILDSHGFTKVYNMLGGISAWQSAGYPVWVATVHNVNSTFNYDTIQAAMDAPQTLDGHTIFVDAGTYYEHAVVTKSVSLIGENRHTTIIDGAGTGTVIRVGGTLSHVNITGFTMQNGRYGIFIELSDSHNISHNIVTNNIDGIFADYPLDSTISNNDVFLNYGYGIFLGSWSSGNTISGNNVSNNGHGICLLTFFPNTLRNNNLNNNTYNFGVIPFYSLALSTRFQHDIDTSNTVDGKPIYWWVNQQNKEIPSDAGCVGLINSKNITVRDLNLTKNGQGVFFVNTNDSLITNVSFSNNIYGIVLIDNSSNNALFHNKFIDNTYQVHVAPIDGYPSNAWDDGYPSGGNYWSDLNPSDLYRGPYQNETGSDGIVDNPYVIDTNNRDRYPSTKPYEGPHDIGIPSLTTSKTILEQGYTLPINLTIVNYGVDTENFNLTAYANTTIIATFANITVISRNSTIVTLTWNTTGFAKGKYILTTNATPVPSETATSDNTYTDGRFLVIISDANGDGVVTGADIVLVLINLGPVPPKPPECDVNGDGSVTAADIVLVLINLG